VFGVVLGVHQEAPAFETRPLLSALSDAPLVADWQLRLARWLARRYACSIAQAVAGFVPPHARQTPRVALTADPSATLEAEPLGPRLLAAFGRRRYLDFATAARAVSADTLGDLLRAGVLHPHPRFDGLPRERLAPVNVSPARSELDLAQQRACDAICETIAARQFGGFLLYGVTGSGKTHVYLHAVHYALRQARQAVVLVSDISLVPAAERHFATWFPGLVAVLHSARSVSEQRDAWERIASGAARIIVGARSALFAPLRDVGLVIVDEEHETAYKQSDQAPSYHARELALMLGEVAGAAVVLGSATPDIATYERARRGELRSLALPRRFRPRAEPGSSRPAAPAASGLPPVQVIDLRAELAAGNTTMFSRALLGALGRALDLGNQAILFLNRRGMATCVTCRDCGHTVACDDCLLPMIYHADLDRLLCHHCNRRRRAPRQCPGCGGARIRYLGAGTQRVEDEVRRHFPRARVLRWDRDTTARRDAHARLWAVFASGGADVLVGTQMVAKALDFPRVTLVGVLLADTGLYLPDYRAGERAFQLLTQVAGRAGRGTQEGQVIVQTYSPQHYAVQAARLQAYRFFARQELAFRRAHGYPPFRRLARLVYAAADEAQCWRECGRVLRALRARLHADGPDDIQILGPAPAYFRRLRGRSRWQILISGAAPERLLGDYVLPAGWTVDVDPTSLL
jgi:primosomal protein N' (replication factor Y)